MFDLFYSWVLLPLPTSFGLGLAWSFPGRGDLIPYLPLTSHFLNNILYLLYSIFTTNFKHNITLGNIHVLVTKNMFVSQHILFFPIYRNLKRSSSLTTTENKWASLPRGFIFGQLLRQRKNTLLNTNLFLNKVRLINFVGCTIYWSYHSINVQK